MSTTYVNASFGLFDGDGNPNTGLSSVGYALYYADGTLATARTTDGVTETPAGLSGVYGASVTLPASPFSGFALFDTGKGGATQYVSVPVNYSAAGSLNSGPYTVTIDFVDGNDDPVPYVNFAVVGVGNAVSGENGVAVISLNAGDYVISASPTAGVIFAPQDISVSANMDVTVAGTSPAPPTPPADPSLCTAYVYLTSEPSFIHASATIVELPTVISGRLLVGSKVQGIWNDSDKYFQFVVPQGASVLFEIPDCAYSEILIIPAQTTWNILV